MPDDKADPENVALAILRAGVDLEGATADLHALACRMRTHAEGDRPPSREELAVALLYVAEIGHRVSDVLVLLPAMLTRQQAS